MAVTAESRRSLREGSVQEISHVTRIRAAKNRPALAVTATILRCYLTGWKFAPVMTSVGKGTPRTRPSYTNRR
jgi:predicted HNH restriction endonuclease